MSVYKIASDSKEEICREEKKRKEKKQKQKEEEEEEALRIKLYKL
jgi:hypothetical protein